MFDHPPSNTKCPSMEAAGNLPASLMDVNHCNKIVYNTGSGRVGNCTRSPVSLTICPKCSYNMTPGGWPEMGREEEALRELVATWHCLTPSVRAAIIDLIR